MPGYGSYSESVYRTLLSRWKARKQVGESKPAMRAYVRTVFIQREFHVGQDQETEVFAWIPGHPRRVWKGKWVPKTGWKRLPNVQEFRGDHDFENKGVQQGTLDIDNVFREFASEGHGAFHRILRGFFAPLRGFGVFGRPGGVPPDTEWFDVLRDKSTQVMVVGGYGDEAVPLFTGLVNDVDLSSRPDTISIICRDVGQLLTDQNVFLNAKMRGIRDPITFADWRSSYDRDPVGHGARAESEQAGHPARFVLDSNKKSEWKSQGHGDPDHKEWIEIHIPKGRYHSIRLHPRFDGMEMWIAMKPSNENVNRTKEGHGSRKAWYGQALIPGDWTNVEGHGNIPGTDVPFIKYVGSVKAKEDQVRLPDFGYVVGDDTVIRLYFSHLKMNDGAHRAGVIFFKGMEADMDEETRKEKWLLVADSADVVKAVFQWIGLNEWEVESSGVPIKDPTVFNRSNFLMDIVNNMAEVLNYVFYVKPPATFDESQEALDSTEPEESMGIGVFRQNQAMRAAGQTQERAEMVHENQTLQKINVKFTDEPLAYNIRVRGKKAGKKKGGRFLGGDRTRRFMYVYRPPWSRDQHPGGNWPDNARDEARNANIKKYVVHHDNKLKSEDECKIAALFIAFAEALKSAQVQIECSALPVVHLDQQIGIFDTGTGISARMWIAMKSVVFRTGQNAHFRMTLGGSLLDTPDLITVRDELEHALRDAGYDPGLSQWQLEHGGRTT